MVFEIDPIDVVADNAMGTIAHYVKADGIADGATASSPASALGHLLIPYGFEASCRPTVDLPSSSGRGGSRTSHRASSTLRSRPDHGVWILASVPRSR